MVMAYSSLSLSCIQAAAFLEIRLKSLCPMDNLSLTLDSVLTEYSHHSSRSVQLKQCTVVSFCFIQAAVLMEFSLHCFQLVKLDNRRRRFVQVQILMRFSRHFPSMFIPMLYKALIEVLRRVLLEIHPEGPSVVIITSMVVVKIVSVSIVTGLILLG
jgi:hypothetical protein